MGALISCRDDLKELLKILGYYEKLERSSGYHYLEYRDFTDYLMFYETFVNEEEKAGLYWNYLKELGLLVELGGSHYLNMGRLCRFCTIHKLDIFVENAEVMDGYNLSYKEDKVLGFIRNTGRLGASEQKIRRLSNEAGLDPWEVPDIIDRLLSLGLVLRTEDDFLRAIPRLRCRRSVCRNGSGKSVSAEDRKFVLKLIYGSWPRGVTFEDLLRKCTVRLIASDRLRDILEELSGRSLICIRDGRYEGA